MGWVPTVGIELLLNSWKDNYLGALGKTPSMYVHMYVECLECLFSGVQTLITFVIKRKMYFAHFVHMYVGKKKNITFYNRHVNNKLG